MTYDHNGTNELRIDNIDDSNGRAPSDGSAVLPDNNSGATPSPATFAEPLVILNDFTILDGRIDANDLDVTIGNFLTIENGGEYDPGNNTTLFNGSSPLERISLSGSPFVTSGGFNNLSFTSSGTEKEFAGDVSTIVVQGDLTIGQGVTLNDGGKVIQVNGDISNSGTHDTDYTAPGRIEITGGSASHEIGGDGLGRFEILTIDDAMNAISLTADQQIDSVLNLVNGVLDISTYELTIRSSAANPIIDDNSGDGATNNFSATRMIQTAGNASDGGLNYFFSPLSDPDPRLYPVGTNANSTIRYTPAVVDISGVIDNGFIAVRPADGVLSTTDVSGGNILSYYWRVSHESFTTLPTVDSYVFTYSDTDDDATDEANFLPGKVLGETPFTRSTDGSTTNVDHAASNANTFGTGGSFPLENANYTAGVAARFAGSPQIYYSAGEGTSGNDWNDPNTWSTVGHYSNTNAGDFPQEGDIAIIGFNPDINSGGGGSQWVTLNLDVTVAQVIFAGDEVLNGSAVLVPRDNQFNPQLTIEEGLGTVTLIQCQVEEVSMSRLGVLFVMRIQMCLLLVQPRLLQTLESSLIIQTADLITILSLVIMLASNYQRPFRRNIQICK